MSRSKKIEAARDFIKSAILPLIEEVLVKKICQTMDVISDDRGELLDALQRLYDVQNGPPLEKHRCDWEEAMEKARNILQGGNHDNQ